MRLAVDNHKSNLVLISTYWNVNNRLGVYNDGHKPVLISTYWNVN